MAGVERFVEPLLFYIVFLLSTTLHEAAHAWAAARGGDLTAYHGGQVSLHPWPHIRRAPVGMVVLPILSVILMGWPFGFATAPYDPRWARQYPRRAAWMALAGPGANLLLLVLCAVAINAGVLGGLFEAPDRISFGHVASATASGWGGEGVAFLLGAVFSLNVVLFAFNLLPLPPLDGSGALPLLMPRAWVGPYQDFVWSQPMLAWVGILVAWRLFDVIIGPVFLAAVNLLYPGAAYS